ncbi:hypothetical protein ES703_106460 [subsurface metagenome]
MNKLAQLLITVSRLDTRLTPLVRLVLILKFVGLLILVSIGLMVGFIDAWWDQRKCDRKKRGELWLTTLTGGGIGWWWSLWRDCTLTTLVNCLKGLVMTCWLSGGRSGIELLKSLRRCCRCICVMRLWLTLLNACASGRAVAKRSLERDELEEASPEEAARMKEA